ncbi:MAG: alpha-glucan family phosphorylase [Kamptonema sp. SIO1D9]|nr:alpha-glucan family phosphorylase [Kamptonema sp. SIO1D9]
MTKSELKTKLPDPLQPLAEIAFNFWWSWSPERLSIFHSINSDRWEEYNYNPVKLLGSISEKRLTQLATDPDYIQRVNKLASEFQQYLAAKDTWASREAPQFSHEKPIAYFSIEYGFHSCIPLYAGGLGILAADYFKSASDLGLPVVGIGLLYHQGYCQQRLNSKGWQEEDYPETKFAELPLELCQDENNQTLTIQLEIDDRQVNLQIWQLCVGRLSVYLLDSNRDDNETRDRGLTARLYGGNQDTRLAQEFLLGIGGVKALQKLAIEPQIYHLNEGHAAFAMLEVARQESERTGKSFAELKEVIKNRGIFTTHTPVPAGHDTFFREQIEDYFYHYWLELGLNKEEFFALGSRKPKDPFEPFNMTVLALRATKAANGVSKLNGAVCRRMWSDLYPDRQSENVPIGYITNGVHHRTWTAPLIADLYKQYLGEDWADRVTDEQMWAKINKIPNSEIWWRHQRLKERLIAYIRLQVQQARIRRGESEDLITAAANIFDSNALTIGFARRFSTYKRGDLIIRDLERVKHIFTNQERPVQIVFAGKAHPADEESKRIMQRLFAWSRQPEFGDRVVLLENYNINLAEKLIQGVDLWLNNPRRSQEASGTSGQKVAFNGGINCSILDGWWCEGYRSNSEDRGIDGWAIGDGCQAEVSQLETQQDAESLYHLLEEEIIPCYYDRDDDGLPQSWIEKMKASIKTIAPYFNSDRMVKEYVNQMYLPQPQVSQTQAEKELAFSN